MSMRCKSCTTVQLTLAAIPQMPPVTVKAFTEALHLRTYYTDI